MNADIEMSALNRAYQETVILLFTDLFKESDDARIYRFRKGLLKIRADYKAANSVIMEDAG